MHGICADLKKPYFCKVPTLCIMGPALSTVSLYACKQRVQRLEKAMTTFRWMGNADSFLFVFPRPRTQFASTCGCQVINGNPISSVNPATLRNPECLAEIAKLGELLRGEVET